jgi:hypothetical protein
LISIEVFLKFSNSFAPQIQKREQGTGNREQGIGNRERFSGSIALRAREQGTGNREQ